MELTNASDFNLHMEESINSNLAMLSIIQVTVSEWKSELILLKNKIITIINFIELSYVPNNCFARQKEDLKKELLQFVDKDFPLFQSKIEKYLRKWESIHFLQKVSFESKLAEFHKLDEDWQNLTQNYLKLEMQIIKGLFQNYPLHIF